MQMINVLKRLAELDASNPNVATPKMTNEQSLGTITNIDGDTINECGPMEMGMGGPASRTPATFSINASAESGDEVSSMLRDIMNLAGVKPAGEELPVAPHQEIELEPAHQAEFEPSAGDDMANAISIIDKMNGPTEEPGAEVGGEEEHGSSPVADMADDVRDMTAELTGEGQAEEERMYTNSPEEETEKHDYGNKQVKDLGQTPEPEKKAGAGNPYTESVEIQSLSSQLLKAYQAFKTQ